MPRLGDLFGAQKPQHNLRVIISRHGERADLTIGPEWFKPDPKNQLDPRVSHMTQRSNEEDWYFDTALTKKGEMQSKATGKKLLTLCEPIDYCYSSPAYRSIQTANKILEGQYRKEIPINIEPGLFECPILYRGSRMKFVTPGELSMDGYFNVDPSYVPIIGKLDPWEDEIGYYRRSKKFMEKLISRHRAHGGTILLTGHAGSIEALTRWLNGSRGAGATRLAEQSGRVDYSNFIIVERDAGSGIWSLRSGSYEDPHLQPIPTQYSIPLYLASSQYLMSRQSDSSLQYRLSRRSDGKHYRRHRRRRQPRIGYHY